MLGIIQAIGYGMVIFLCLFALMVFYYAFRGGIGMEDDNVERSIGGRVLDRTAWGMHGLQLLWIALRHRRRLWRMVELSFADEFDEEEGRFGDTGEVVTLLEGMVVTSHIFDDGSGRALYIRRPFQFLEHDWTEATGFRRKDGRVT